MVQSGIGEQSLFSFSNFMFTLMERKRVQRRCHSGFKVGNKSKSLLWRLLYCPDGRDRNLRMSLTRQMESDCK